MHAAASGKHSTGLSGPVAFGAGLVLLALAPLIRGGNRHVALMVLEWLGLLLVLLLALQQAGAPQRMAPGWSTVGNAQGVPGKGILVLALAPLWVALVQLVPLPAGVWGALPGREVYLGALTAAQIPVDAFRPLSLVPDATWLSVLAGIPLTAAFLLAHTCSFRRLNLLARALVVLALAQAVLGLFQLGPFPALYFDAALGGRAIGTFANPNHFANYIAMSLPLAILMLRHSSGAGHGKNRAKGRWVSSGTLWGVALFLLLAAVLASSSRGGTTTALLVTLLAVIVLPRQQRHPRARRWGLAGAAALLALVAVAVGVDALISRFETDHAGYLGGDRWLMVTSAWRAGLAFAPAGSGLGTFAAVFPAFQPPGVRGFVEHAHNDYVQLFMECGGLFVVLGGLAVTRMARQVARLARLARTTGLDAPALLQASCGLGVLAVLLHSWVDFNLRIPANAMLAAFLLGAFLRPLGPIPPERGGQSPPA